MAWAINLLFVLYWLRGVELTPRIIKFPESKADKTIFILTIIYCGFLFITQIGYFFPSKFSRLKKINNLLQDPHMFMPNENFSIKLKWALAYFPCNLSGIILVSQVGWGNKVRVPLLSIFPDLMIYSLFMFIAGYYSTFIKGKAK
jgi:hypothetical protein